MKDLDEPLPAILLTRPWQSFLLLNFGLACGVAGGEALFSGTYINGAGLGAMLVLVGWTALVCQELSKGGLNSQSRLQRNAVWAAYGCTVAAHFLYGPLIMSDTSTWWLAVLSVVVWAAGFFGPLYVFWSASKLLVEIEEEQSVAKNRVFGTFLAFFFLPLGVIFIQRRILRLSAKSEIGG